MVRVRRATTGLPSSSSSSNESGAGDGSDQPSPAASVASASSSASSSSSSSSSTSSSTSSSVYKFDSAISSSSRQQQQKQQQQQQQQEMSAQQMGLQWAKRLILIACLLGFVFLTVFAVLKEQRGFLSTTSSLSLFSESAAVSSDDHRNHKKLIYKGEDYTADSSHTFDAAAASQVSSDPTSRSTSSRPSSSVVSAAVNRTVFKTTEPQCTVWIAPSSIKGHSGYGIYTTRHLQLGENILGGPDGVAIPLITSQSTSFPHAAERAQWRNVWNEYWWVRGLPDHDSFEHPPHMADFQIGFGALPNHHCLLHVLSAQYPEPPYDDTFVARGDPGMGAFTYSRGREFVVQRSVEPLSEIFLNYGYCERGTGRNPEWAENFVYMTQDYQMARDLVWDYKYGRGTFNYSAHNGGAIVPPSDVHPLVANLLPQTKEEYDQVMHRVITKDHLMFKLARHALHQRSSDWIHENGLCMENLLPRKSTLQHAGQGGFAQFDMQSGQIVAPAPLLQIINKDAMILYGADGNTAGYQLLLNYCWGHAESTLLLCPNSNAQLINHCSIRSKECGPDGPNAKIQWSTGWDPSSDVWRNQSLDFLAEQPGRGLAFEIVALRDIPKGQEVFVDYGEEWEHAWQDHVAHWKPPPQLTHHFLSAKEANENGGPIPKDFISGNLRNRVHHPYLFTGCQYWSSEQDNHANYHRTGVNWKNMTDQKILEYYADDGQPYRYSGTRGYKRHHDGSHWPCSVIGPNLNNPQLYTVRIHQSPLGRVGDTAWQKNHLPRFLINYPRSSIHYFVQPYMSDQHLKGVFRHPIGIPDELFPDQWRNLKS